MARPLPSEKPPEAMLRLKVVCSELPGKRFRDPCGETSVQQPVYLGIQKGRDVIEQVPADQQEVTFAPDFKVVRREDGSVNFLGPFAQGPPTDRFFYLSWGIKGSSGDFAMFRRLKIRLGHLRWKEIQNAIGRDRPLTVRLRLTDGSGGPLCATPPTSHIDWERS